MNIKVEGYDMSKEELISKVVQLQVENSALNLKILAITQLLIEKGLTTGEEIDQSYKVLMDIVDEQASVQGIDTEQYKEFLREYLGIA